MNTQRWVRHFEIVSHVYYKMLRKHGQDPALREMCSLIIRDEAGHIAFHRSRLADDGAENGSAFGGLWGMRFRLRGLMAGTVLWVNHRGALLALGASDLEFYRWIWRDANAFINALRGEMRSGLRRSKEALADDWTGGDIGKTATGSHSLFEE